MDLIDTILSKKKKLSEKKKQTVVFVNYEHWLYSLQKLYHLKPDLESWRESLMDDTEIKDIYFFADFSVPYMEKEKERVQKITVGVIDTQDAALFHKRSMTDIIMVNHIYQYLLEHPEVQKYIIFSGNGQLQFVVEYLRYRQNKKIILYGVKDAISVWLRGSVDEVIEIPAKKETVIGIYPLIVENLIAISGKKNSIATFMGMTRAVAKRHGLSEDLVHAALAEMLTKGLLYKSERQVTKEKSINIIEPDWAALEKAGFIADEQRSNVG